MRLAWIGIAWLLAGSAAAQPQGQVTGATAGAPEMRVGVVIAGRMWGVDAAPVATATVAGRWQRRRTTYGGLVVKVGGVRPASGAVTVVSRDGACRTRVVRRAVFELPQYATYRRMGWVAGERREAIELAGCVPRTDHGAQAALVIAGPAPVQVDAADDKWLIGPAALEAARRIAGDRPWVIQGANVLELPITGITVFDCQSCNTSGGRELHVLRGGRRLVPEGFGARSWLFLVDQRIFHVGLEWSGEEGVPFADAVVVTELRDDALAPVARLPAPVTFPSFESPEW